MGTKQLCMETKSLNRINANKNWEGVKKRTCNRDTSRKKTFNRGCIWLTSAVVQPRWIQPR